MLWRNSPILDFSNNTECSLGKGKYYQRDSVSSVSPILFSFRLPVLIALVDGLCSFPLAFRRQQIRLRFGLSPLPLFKAQEVGVIFLHETGIGKAEVSIVAYYDVVQDLYLHDTAGED